MVVLDLLGGASLTADGVPVRGRAAQRSRLALLALLGVSRAEPVAREKLCFILWPDAGVRARHLLSNSVYILRRALGEDAIVGGVDALRLNPDRVRCDVREFEAALARGDPAGAVRLYRGPFLDGFFLSDTPEFEAWAQGERDRLRLACAQALEALAREREAAGDFGAAARRWRELHALDPLASRVVLRLMRALEAAREVDQAVQCARAYESAVRAELDIDPDPSVTAFADRLVRERGYPPTFPGLDPKETAGAAGLGGDSATEPAAESTSVQPALAPPVAESARPSPVGSLAPAATVPGPRRRARPLHLAALALVAVVAIVTLVRVGPGSRAAYDDSPGVIAREMAREVGPQTTSIGGRPGTSDVAAYELYVRGSDPALHRSDSGVEAGLEYLGRAIALDSTFAAAHAALARLHVRSCERSEAGPCRDRIALAEAAAARAVDLDDSLAEAHGSLGWVHMATYRFGSAEAELRRAIELEPGRALFHEWLVDVLVWQGRAAEALAEAENGRAGGSAVPQRPRPARPRAPRQRPL